LTCHTIIAIDGPAGAGKSTVARRLAGRLGFVYVDTGAMYRAIALKARRAGIGWSDAARLAALARAARVALTCDGKVLLDGEDVTLAIREPEISDGASQDSAVSDVRRAMVELQQAFGRAESIVMEGRDIGTVVFPDTPHKFFVTASPETRAKRRLAQAGETAPGATVASVAAEIAERDRRDATRAVAPLRPAADAVTIDSDALTAEEVADRICARV